MPRGVEHEIGNVYVYVFATFGWWLAMGIAANGLVAFIARLTGFELPRRFFVTFAMLAIFFAGYMAWRDEHGAATDLTRKLSDEYGAVAELERKLSA